MTPNTVVRSDEALMTDIAEGDTAALGQLYMRHSQAVRAMIGYVAPAMSSHDVDDVTQEVFLSLGKAAKSYRHEALFNAFLFRIASNRARDWLRRSWVRGRFTKNDDLKIVSTPGAGMTAAPGQQTMLSQTIRQILESLTYNHREVLVLNIVQGLTCDEIADVLNIRPKTVRTRLHRARAAVLQHRHAAIWKDAISETTP
ncbi:MAG: RNA polymerase sigma factor [Deltaproteobacteria bacterium]|nr:RNA polymerase sigma factor [Deltaproteobacteria bacterium]